MGNLISGIILVIIIVYVIDKLKEMLLILLGSGVILPFLIGALLYIFCAM